MGVPPTPLAGRFRAWMTRMSRVRGRRPGGGDFVHDGEMGVWSTFFSSCENLSARKGMPEKRSPSAISTSSHVNSLSMPGHLTYTTWQAGHAMTSTLNPEPTCQPA